jgi:hypothetical protein
MPDLFLTRHAIQRYRERVADLPACEIWRALDIPAVRIAIDFGARFVRLSGGQRVVLDQHRVVSILPRDYRPCCLDRRNDPASPDEGDHAQG